MCHPFRQCYVLIVITPEHLEEHKIGIAGIFYVRTCARLCHSSGGELEQIQFLLGHASVQTTERYNGSKQKLQDAVKDRLGISVVSNSA